MADVDRPSAPAGACDAWLDRWEPGDPAFWAAVAGPARAAVYGEAGA